MQVSNWKQARFVAYVLATQAVMGITLVLDIPFARQVLGFLFLIFVPGFVLLRVFRLERPSMAESVLFSIGLSIAFLMLVGLLINELGSANFISRPLSTEPLAVIINITVALMSILSYFRNKEDANINDIKALRSPLITPYLALPLLGVIGVISATALKNNLLLISIMIIIPIFFLLSLFNSKASLYSPLTLVSIALALLLSTSLMSHYVYGDDMQLEYRIFTATRDISYWNRQAPGFLQQFVYQSMLSITILPTIFSVLLNIEEVWIFKIVFPMIFSLVPLGLYQLYQIHWGKKAAFMSAVFFVANYEFFSVVVRNSKQMIAYLFYILLFVVLLKKSVTYDKRSKWMIIMLFLFALVVSHYSMIYIFLFLVLSTWFLGKVFVKDKNTKIDSTIVAFSACFTFLWYMFVVQGPFNDLLVVLEKVLRNFMTEFFYAGSRGEVVQAAAGVVESPSVLHYVGSRLHNVTMALILIGFISLLAKWRARKEKLDSEYVLITILNMGLVVSAVLIPRFAGILEVGRLYNIALLFLSPLFVLGGETLLMAALNLKGKGMHAPRKRETYCLILISTVLVTFFLFQSGVVYEITNDPVPSSISLSKYKMEDSYVLVHENDVFGAMWLSKFGDVENVRSYSDTVSFYHVLTSYSTISRNMIILISNTTMITGPSYVYFRQFNVIKGIIVYDTKAHTQYNINELQISNSTLVHDNRIYSNGACEIYYDVPNA